MPTNRNARDKSPHADDAVLGGEARPLPIGGVVLGGIEGVKRRLAAAVEEQRIAALCDGLNYGEAGLELVLEALQDESPKVQFAAYSLLKDSDSSKVKQYLSNYLPWFEFDVLKVDAQGVINSRYKKQAQFLAEDLCNGVTLEMVAIPGGTFIMGSSKTEKGYRLWESPQHQVKLQSFFMGKYSVTQAQWEAIVALPQVNSSLNRNPSRFKGANLPVEQISWYDAVEFCARLSQKTGRQYRLPSEAEWEYACRAGTNTPFHFGETITSKIANYRGTKTYSFEPKGEYREQTTPVGHFQVANAFGLYDMHGSVCEWCADRWHYNYVEAPTDGSVWSQDNANDYRARLLREKPTGLLRGGSWYEGPLGCRSAFRLGYVLGDSPYDCFGFRVVCEAA